MKQSDFPFVDFTKMMSEFNLPGVDVSALMEAQKRNLDALTEANRSAAEGLAKMAGQQQEILRRAMENWQSMAATLSDSADPEERTKKQAELARSALEQAFASMREMAETATRTQSEQFETIHRRFLETLQTMQQSTDKT